MGILVIAEGAMSDEGQKTLHGRTQDSLTTRHIEQKSELLRTLTTAHIEQKIVQQRPENAPSTQNQNNTSEVSSGGVAQQNGSGDKK
jgi:hypothetical protein